MPMPPPDVVAASIASALSGLPPTTTPEQSWQIVITQLQAMISAGTVATVVTGTSATGGAVAGTGLGSLT